MKGRVYTGGQSGGQFGDNEKENMSAGQSNFAYGGNLPQSFEPNQQNEFSREDLKKVYEIPKRERFLP